MKLHRRLSLRHLITLTLRNPVFVCLGVLLIASCAFPPSRRQASQPTTPYQGSAAEKPVEETYVRTGWPKPNEKFEEAEFPILRVSYPTVAEAEFIHDDELCAVCHETYVHSFAQNVHRKQSCEDCHGPASRHLSSRGKDPESILSFKRLPAPAAAELCLKCHEQNACTPGATWRTSVHAHHGLACVSCHRAHYNVPPGTPATSLDQAQNIGDELIVPIQFSEEPADQAMQDKANLPSLRGTSNHLGAVAPYTCYRCHQDQRQLQAIAHPHQIGGANGFNCTTCHDPHGKILDYSRKDLCLTCHTGSPTASWHSSIHQMAGVSCTDCHDPHPESHVQQVVNIDHTQIARPKRLPMSVNDPRVCYKCHANIYAQNAMPSHHPIKEGKMVCADCHDPHGGALDNLKEPTLNMVCYKCHADKQGPFAYEHPPVTQNCGICHNPHGTVANNMLHQPTTFLCLRCHTGHRVGSSAVTPGFPTTHPGGAQIPDVGVTPGLQRAFYSDCTQCHAQIHGSDLPSPHNAHAFDR